MSFYYLLPRFPLFLQTQHHVPTLYLLPLPPASPVALLRVYLAPLLNRYLHFKVPTKRYPSPSHYDSQGRSKEAERLELLLLRTRKRILSEQHVNTIASKINLGIFYWGQNRLTEAKALELGRGDGYLQANTRQKASEYTSVRVISGILLPPLSPS